MHSSIKIICNAPIALLQILNNYTYPQNTSLGKTIKVDHFQNICIAIFNILNSYEKTNPEKVKKFLMFDTLNDIFSRQFSKNNIEQLTNISSHNKYYYGAKALIQAIYEYKDIQELKASEPNYWLQRAKSIYIMNSGKDGKIELLKRGINWAKKAEGDAEILVLNGKNKYQRTLSNAIIQIAMIYGNLAYKLNYSDKEINTFAIDYYYTGLLDSNNANAAQSLIVRSKGTNDYKELIKHIISNKNCIDPSVIKQASYLINCSIFSNQIKSNQIKYS